MYNSAVAAWSLAIAIAHFFVVAKIAIETIFSLHFSLNIPLNIEDPTSKAARFAIRATALLWWERLLLFEPRCLLMGGRTLFVCSCRCRFFERPRATLWYSLFSKNDYIGRQIFVKKNRFLRTHSFSRALIHSLSAVRSFCKLVELKNGETYNGHLVVCDSWMNLNLRQVICTSRVTSIVFVVVHVLILQYSIMLRPLYSLLFMYCTLTYNIR